MAKEKVWWLDGLKLLACIFVFWCHLPGFIKIQSLSAQPILGLEPFFNFFPFLLNGNFWVFVFCIISGIFAGKKRIESLKELFCAVVNRYVRFILPFLFSALIIVALSLTIGFRSNEMGELYGNEWIAPFYAEPITAGNLLKYIFLMDDELNPFIWTIRTIFIGNVFTYLMNYLTRKLDESKRNIIYLAVFLVLALAFIATQNRLIYSTACFLGTLVPMFFSITEKINRPVSLVLLVAALTVFKYHNVIVEFIMTKITLPGSIDFYLINTCWNFVYAFIFFVLLNNLKSVKSFLGTKLFQKSGSLSLPIYFLHCPLLCSVILSIVDVMLNHNPNQYTSLILFLLTTVIVIAAAFIYDKTFGKLSNIISGKINDSLNSKVLKKEKIQ